MIVIYNINRILCATALIEKMPSCAVRICRNTSRTQNKSKGVTFHRFPADPVQRDKWASVLRKCRHDEHWIPHKYTYICSAHFKDDDIYVTDRGIRRFSNTAYPKLNLYNENFEAYPTVEHSSPTAQPFESNNINEEGILLDENSQLILDTPREVQLKTQISKKDILLRRYVRKIRALQATIRRLTKKNDSFKDIIRKIKKAKVNPPIPELTDNSNKITTED